MKEEERRWFEDRWVEKWTEQGKEKKRGMKDN